MIQKRNVILGVLSRREVFSFHELGKGKHQQKFPSGCWIEPPSGNPEDKSVAVGY